MSDKVRGEPVREMKRYTVAINEAQLSVIAAALYEAGPFKIVEPVIVSLRKQIEAQDAPPQDAPPPEPEGARVIPIGNAKKKEESPT